MLYEVKMVKGMYSKRAGKRKSVIYTTDSAPFIVTSAELQALDGQVEVVREILSGDPAPVEDVKPVEESETEVGGAEEEVTEEEGSDPKQPWEKDTGIEALGGGWWKVPNPKAEGGFEKVKNKRDARRRFYEIKEGL